MRRAVVVSAVLLTAIVVTAIAWKALAFTYDVAAQLDQASELAELTPQPQATIVYDRYGKAAFTFFSEQRVDVPLDRVSPKMIDALLAVEDKRFNSHHGLDPVRIVSAAWHNARAHRIVQGGSTITQQLARASKLSPTRTFERKIREAAIASRLEQRYSKQEILEAYLNAVYFGEGYYGVEAASRGYFGKSAMDLNAQEAALLAALVRSPATDEPCISPKRATARRNLVLRLMRDQHRLSADEFQLASAAKIPDPSHRTAGRIAIVDGANGTGLYFQEELRRQLVSQFGSERVLRGGLRVYSTYDPKLQQLAEQAITTRLKQIAASNRRAKELQGSLVTMDPTTGDVYALVGGRDFKESSFNRATQAKRQAGSAFKPIVYAAALERGYAPGTLLRDLDTPILAYGPAWLPAGDHERTEYTLRRALTVSSNRAAAQLMQQVGTTTTVYYAQRLGIQSELPMVPSLALGTGEVTLLELTTAYTAFANRGIASMPRLYTRVDDADGNALHFQEERHTRALSEGTAYMMSSMLSDVITAGTASGARAAGFKLPAGGKTGTSDDYEDAWFVGYTPHLVTGVWFGLDRPAPIMANGLAGIIAVPAWARFMRDATAGARRDWYDMPSDLEKVKICSLSGARATDACRHDVVPASMPFDAAQGRPVGTSGDYGTLGDSATDSLTTVPQLPAPAPRGYVYEDIFPIGAVPSEECPLHSGRYGYYQATMGTTATGTESMTPLVDAAVATTGSAVTVRSVNPRIYVERVVGADGITRLVMKQR
jgi:1A family penicillin-binding protein